MQILIARADARWNEWIAKVLSPVISAFDHKKIQLHAPPGTAAFDVELANVLAECEAVIAFNPADGAADPPHDWPKKALEHATVNKYKTTLIRVPDEPLLYPDAPHLMNCDLVESAEAILAVVGLLGSWRLLPRGRFLLGPPDLIAKLQKDFNKKQIIVEYSIDSPGYVRSPSRVAELIVSPGELEVRTEPLRPGSRIQLRLLAPDGEYESGLSLIDRRVMDLAPTVAFDPREAPFQLAGSGSAPR